MGTTVGRQADALALFASLASTPFRHDFYQTLRRLECLFPDKPRWGSAARPGDEPVRLGQEPELTFAPAPLASFAPNQGGVPRLNVRLFGLLGPNGPLPLHITELARDRLRQAGDPTLSRFLDLFNHRFIAFLYRAWAQAQPHVQRDRPDEDRFAAYVAAFVGLSPTPFRHRDSLPDVAKWFHAGTLVRQTRDPDGLAGILRHFFGVTIEVEQFVGHWLPLGEAERTRLGRADGGTLGRGAVLGRRVWDRQYKFRIHVGPLTLAEYESFLPGGRRLHQLVEWVRFYNAFELAWDARLRLERRQVPALRLDGRSRLGWTTWLGTRRAKSDAADLCLAAETFDEPVGVPV